MNVKKYLKKQAQKDQQAILDADNGKTLRALGVEYSATPQRHRNRTGWLIGAASAVASIVLIVCIIMFYPFQRRVEYVDINFESRASTVSEMNGELHDFSFTIDETIYSTQITRTHDRISGDVLYYKLSLYSYDSLVKTEFIAVCNPRYTYKDFYFTATPQQKELSRFNVLYSSYTEPDLQFGLNRLSCIAEIDGKTDTVYVTKYEELLDKPDPAFFGVIESIVQPVNK